MTQDEINELSKQSFLRGEIENRRDFNVGFKAAQSKMYSEEDMLGFFNYLLSQTVTRTSSIKDKEEYMPKEFKLLKAELLNNSTGLIKHYFETIKKK